MQPLGYTSKPGRGGSPRHIAGAVSVTVPPIGYPAELPMSARKDELVGAIREHQAGGSGRDRVGEDDAAPEDVPGAGPDRDRAHAAAPAGRAHGRGADRPGDGSPARAGGRL